MNKSSIGAWILTYNPAATDVISKSGFDWVCIDLEHSSLNFTELSVLLNVLEKNKTESFVRVSSNDKTQIKKALDLGAKGIIVPMVNNAVEAKKAVDCSYYPPFGSRGLGFARAQGFGFDLNNYLKKFYHLVKPSLVGFVILFLTIVFILYAHSEYISWVEISGRKIFLGYSYLLKNILKLFHLHIH